MARVALVVHALSVPAVPRRSRRWFLPWGRGQCNRTTCDAPLTCERARSARLCGRQHPAALGLTARLAGPVLWEKRLSTVPTASLFFAYTLAARCSGRRFLPFWLGGWSTPQLTLREDGHSGRLAAANERYRWPPANARCGGPPPPHGGIETAGRPPKVTMPSTVLPCDCCPCILALPIPVWAIPWGR